MEGMEELRRGWMGETRPFVIECMTEYDTVNEIGTEYRTGGGVAGGGGGSHFITMNDFRRVH